MWVDVDQYNFDNENFTNPNKNYCCDRCNKDVIIPFYQLYSQELTVDLCADCFNNENIRSLFVKKIIDRIKYDIEEKPLLWPCLICKKKLGGGFEWFTYELDELDELNVFLAKSRLIFDVCKDCDNENEVYNIIKNKFLCITEDYICCNRTMNCALLNISSTKRVIPKEIEMEITPTRIKKWADTYESIVYIDSHFGPIKQWVLFTDFYNIPNEDIMTGLLIDCGVNTNGRIASLVIDDHGRMGINIIYDNINDYLKELKEWDEKRLKGESLKEKKKDCGL